MEQLLRSWSWQDLFDVYKNQASILGEYEALKTRCNIPDSIDPSYSDDNNILIMRFNKEVNEVGILVDILDQEVARRYQLIGVMG